MMKAFAESGPIQALGERSPVTYGAFCKAPFDTLGDTLRGTQPILKYMYRRPDKLLEALDVVADFTIKSVLTAPNVANIFMSWGINDVFVVPPCKRYQHNASEETVLFSISDRPAQEALGIWREEH